MAAANPSTFTISTNAHATHLFNSHSPNSNLVNRVPGGANGSSNGGNTTAKHDPARQTLASDMMLPTESSAKHRDNIKQFSFKPGNLKVKSNINSKNTMSTNPSQLKLKAV